ncbi:phage portal protein [Solibacillus sp. FSL R7-0682]|uniref:phage portal protein n=1 Tax=Solibacillus sp. FSL R7-0682 TaxID=2921690 RepID=UPI0030F51237
MSTLEEYIASKYKGNKFWFKDEIAQFINYNRIHETREYKEYLDGQHDILNNPNYMYNGQLVSPRKIVINLAKTIINFKTQYLLKNPVNLVGDVELVKQLNMVNKLGKFDNKNEKILNHMIKYGQVSEYLFINNKGRIDSKIIDAESGTPIYNRTKELIGFIEFNQFDGKNYYTVYSENAVEEYNDLSGSLQLVKSSPNLSGLPVVYTVEDDLVSNKGRSDLKDYINILDNMEDLLSKYTESFYKFMNPIPVAIGQQLETTVPQNVVSGGFNLDDGADFKLVSNEMDYKTFESVYKTLNQTLLDVSSTPAVSMNKTDISNLSEVSIKLLFSLADTNAGVLENYIMDGLTERYEKVAKLLGYKGIKITDEQLVTLEFKFVYNTPSNHKEILDNMKTQYDMGAISTETIIDNSPYVNDKLVELTRLQDVPVPVVENETVSV